MAREQEHQCLQLRGQADIFVIRFNGDQGHGPSGNVDPLLADNIQCLGHLDSQAKTHPLSDIDQCLTCYRITLSIWHFRTHKISLLTDDFISLRYIYLSP